MRVPAPIAQQLADSQYSQAWTSSPRAEESVVKAMAAKATLQIPSNKLATMQLCPKDFTRAA
jgi:hypothetical protein